MTTIYVNQAPTTWPKLLGCDIETTGLDPHVDHLLSIALSDGKDVWVFLHTHGFQQARVPLSDPSVCKIFHFAKFDVKFIKAALGIDVPTIYCTMLAEQVFLGGREQPVGLDDVLSRRLGVVLNKSVRKEFIGHPGFHIRPVSSAQLTYMAGDVRYLPDLRNHQLADLRRDRMVNVAQSEFDCVPAFVDMELHGLRLDVDLWMTQVAWFNEQITQCETTMRTLIGSHSITVERTKNKQGYLKTLAADEINFNSSDQLKAVLQQHFNLPIHDTRDETLQEILLTGAAKVSPEGMQFVSLVTLYRKWNKRIGFNYPKFVHPKTGRVHPTVHQTGADTGRVSISKPGLHQVPRPAANEPNMRHLWRADTDEYVIVRVDYSQQEPRILAHLSADPAMIKACNEQDVYIAFAEHLYGRVVDKASEERQITKAFVLAVGYGAGPLKLHQASGRPFEDCTRIRNQILAQFPIMVAYADDMKRFEQQYGYVQTAANRRRYFVKKGGFRFTQAVNTAVQGTAADMFKLALGRLQMVLTDMKKAGKIDTNTRVWHVVHDEICVQAHKDQVDIVMPIIISIMEEAGHDLCPSVKHIAEAKVGPTWDK